MKLFHSTLGSVKIHWELRWMAETCSRESQKRAAKCSKTSEHILVLLTQKTWIPLLSQTHRSNGTFYVENLGFDNTKVHWVFRINYMYYRWVAECFANCPKVEFNNLFFSTFHFSLIGALLVAIVGYPISILTGGTKNLDQNLLSPLFRKHKDKYPVELTTVVAPEEIKKLKEKCQDDEWRRRRRDKNSVRPCFRSCFSSSFFFFSCVVSFNFPDFSTFGKLFLFFPFSVSFLSHRRIK